MEAGRSSKFLSLGMTRNSCFYKIITIIFGRGFGQDYGVSSCFCPEESGKGDQLSSMSSWLAIFQLYNRSARSVILGDNSCIAFGSYWPYQEVCSSSATSSLPRLTCVGDFFKKILHLLCATRWLLLHCLKHQHWPFPCIFSTCQFLSWLHVLNASSTSDRHLCT